MHYNTEIRSGRAVLAAQVMGSGTPVVFLHAADCDSRMWRSEAEAVSKTARAIAYDRRSFGQTTAEAEDHSAVADLVAVIEAAGEGKPAILVACSQGGRVALDAALLRPSHVRGLVLVSPSVIGAPDPVYPAEIQALLAAQQRAMEADDLERANAIKAHLWLDGPLQPEGRVTGEARQLFLDMNGIALRSKPVGAMTDAVQNFQRLHEIAVPAAVLCGDYDFPHIQQRCRQMASAMPNATHQVLADAAHLPSLEQRPEVAAEIMALIRR